MKLVIEGKQHPSLNQWINWHWGKRKKIKEKWAVEIAELAKEFGSPELNSAFVEINYYFNNKHRRDKDNYSPKFIMDALVKAGLIEDDNTNNIYLNWKILYDKERPRTEIIIKEAAVDEIKN